jgi:hypothetical protein
MLGLRSASENSGPSRPAPRDGAGADDPQRTVRRRDDQACIGISGYLGSRVFLHKTLKLWDLSLRPIG